MLCSLYWNLPLRQPTNLYQCNRNLQESYYLFVNGTTVYRRKFHLGFSFILYDVVDYVFLIYYPNIWSIQHVVIENWVKGICSVPPKEIDTLCVASPRRLQVCYCSWSQGLFQGSAKKSIKKCNKLPIIQVSNMVCVWNVY